MGFYGFKKFYVVFSWWFLTEFSLSFYGVSHEIFIEIFNGFLKSFYKIFMVI